MYGKVWPFALLDSSGSLLSGLPCSYNQKIQMGPELFLIAETWEPDYASSSCRMCAQDWSFFERWRHHCRCCGKLVCNACSPHQSAICDNKPAQRTCKSCYNVLLAVKHEETLIEFLASTETLNRIESLSTISACSGIFDDNSPKGDTVEGFGNITTLDEKSEHEMQMEEEKGVTSDCDDDESDFALDAEQFDMIRESHEKTGHVTRPTSNSHNPLHRVVLTEMGTSPARQQETGHTYRRNVVSIDTTTDIADEINDHDPGDRFSPTDAQLTPAVGKFFHSVSFGSNS